MHDVLDAVTARHPVGLITNGPSDIQRLKLEQSGLDGPLRVGGHLRRARASASREPSVFLGLLEGLGADPAASVMVGDSWERDVLGALGAGMSAVWIADGRPVPEHRDRVVAVDTCYLPDPGQLTSCPRTGRRRNGGQPAIWRSM